VRLHFAYTLPRRRHRPTRVFAAARRIAERARQRLGIEPGYRTGAAQPGLRPLRAPYSITYNLSRFLSERVPTILYDWDERILPAVGPDDIILGHPHPDPETVIQRLFRDEVKCRAKLLIFPVHHGVPYGDSINRFTLPLVERAETVLGIMGLYWYDTLATSQLATWKHKIVRVDMAVDPLEYPFLKRRFNAPGRRGYLHIGSGRPEKGMGVLDRTMAGLSQFPRASIGPGTDIPNMRHLASEVHLTPEFVSALAQDYDFFVCTPLSDPNPTTILEAMAWGFPVACTPQSGYYDMPSIVTLSTADIDANVHALLELQHAPEERLLDISRTNRELIEKHYTWERFCSTVWQALEPYLGEGTP
jgi:glycosyltransferase involved in cell wall biosynthesis